MTYELNIEVTSSQLVGDLLLILVCNDFHHFSNFPLLCGFLGRVLI